MRFLFCSILVASAASLASPAEASMIYSESTSSAPAGSFSLKLSAGSSGAAIFDGFRTLDGKNFYVDDASPKNRPAFSGAFSVVGGSNSQAFGANSSNTGNNGAVIGVGREGFSLGSGDGKESSNFGFAGGRGSSFGGVTLNGSNPLSFAFASLGDNRMDDRGWGGQKADVSATPLPPTWTMILVGFGCFGLITQRLRKNKKNEKDFAVA